MISKYFVFAIFVALARNVVGTSDPPRIFPAPPELTVEPEEKVMMHCEGKRPVMWILPPQSSYHEQSSSMINMSATLSTPDQNYPYGITLEIFGVEYKDVGYYSCIYNDTFTENIENNLENLVDNGEADRIYLYVEDENNFYVPAEYVVQANQFEEVIIPCRPTFPQVKVTLYKDDQKISADFDPKVGFRFNADSLADHGQYTCSFHNPTSNDTDEFSIMLFLTTRTTSVPKPEITQEGTNSGHAIEGRVLVLHCRVKLTVPGILFKLTWTTPKLATFASDRVNQSDTKQKQINDVVHGESTLTVYDVRKEDEGPYVCKVTDNSKNTNSASRIITVVNPNTSFINLSEPTGRTSIETKAGVRFIQWNVKIKAFPEPKLIWYNPKGHEIQAGWGSANGASHYEIRNTQDSSLFKINNVEIEDAGIYQLRAMTEATEATFNITLIVKVQPEIIFADSSAYNMINTLAVIECYVTGFPLPNVYWNFQPCPNYPECEKEVSIPSHQFMTKQSTHYVMTSTLTLNATETGYVICGGSNELGNKNLKENFFVTDIPDGYAVWAAPPHQVGGDNKLEVPLGDSVTLVCGANIYNFSDDLSWMHITDSENYFLQPTDDISITSNYTQYSYRTELTFNAMRKDQSGEYGCRANKIEPENLYDVTYISVIVRDLEPPSIISTNLNSSDILRSLGEPLKLYCVAEGVPAPEITWYKDDIEIKPEFGDPRISLEQNGTLLYLRYMRLVDEGTYSCTARNKNQNDRRVAKVILTNKPGLHIAVTAALIAIALLFIICILFLAFKVKKEKKLRKELAIAGLANFEEGAMDSINPELGVDEQADLLPYDRKWEFPRDKLKLGKQLGSGAFGVVLKAEAQGICEGEESSTVAVKMVKRTADPAFIKALASELKVMVHLGKHLNVVNLLGACTKNVIKRELLVIVEFCRFGNIHNYLLRHRNAFIDQIDPETGRLDPTIGEEQLQRSGSVSSGDFTMYATTATGDSDNSGYLPPISGGPNTGNTAVTLISMTPTGEEPLMSNNSIQPEWRSNYRGDYREQNVRPVCTQDLLCWAFQIARGMEYLASRKVLHGDLAARNILLAEDNVVKICDFGLARSMYKDDNYQKKGEGPLPVKWMAIESIRDRIFSTQSDIWSFGVTMWELFSLARTPYPGMEANEKLYLRLVEGYRMERPQFANEAIYQTMLDCWHATPTNRPSFTDLTLNLGSMLEDTVRIHYVDLNDPYLTMNSAEQREGGDYLAMMSSPDITQLQPQISDPNYVNTRAETGISLQDVAGADYLCMSPTKSTTSGIVNQNGVASTFQFPSPARKQDDRNHVELTPMLTNTLTHSDTESESASPVLGKIRNDAPNAVANPSYHKLFDKTWVGNGTPPSNYANVNPNNNLVEDSSRHYVN